MKFDLRRFFKVLLIAIIVLNLAFIYSRSLKSPEESTAESDKAGEIVGEIIPPETPVGGYVQDNIRKLAHFTEFFVLGVFASLYVIFYTKGYKYPIYSLLFGFVSAFIDETVQVFSGRGASVTDVWIDLLGFAASSAIIYTVYYLTVYIYNKRKQKLTNNG